MKRIFPMLFMAVHFSIQAQTIETAFSPEAGGEVLVVKVIGSAKHEIRLAAYSFTSAPIVQALLEAKHRGVDVQIVVDEKDNTRSAKPRAALGALDAAGIPVHVNGHYAIHHDKYIVIDDETVETGSFNFTAAAAKHNSENVIVVWNDPAVAKSYLAHWQNRFDEAQNFTGK